MPCRTPESPAAGTALSHIVQAPVHVVVIAFMVIAFALLAFVAPATAQDDDTPPAPILTDIVIEGNHKTDTQVIMRELGVQIGDPLSEDQIDEIWDRLEDAGYFAFVDMGSDEVEDGEIVLHITVEEDKTLHYGPLIRYDLRWNYLLGGWIRDRNLRGKGETLEADLVLYRIQRLRASWTRPYLFNVRGLQLKVPGAMEHANFVFRPTDFNAWDAGLDLRWTFLGPVFVSGEVQYSGFEQLDGYTWPQPYRGAGSDTSPITYPAATRHTWTFGGSLGADARDNRFYPLRGFYAQLRGLWHEGVDYPSFAEVIGDVRLFLPLPWRHVVAMRAYGRSVSDPVPIENALYWGGATTVRGYHQFSYEGEHGYLLSAEYRAPLFLMPTSPMGEMVGFGLHAFTDVGDNWFDGASSGQSLIGYGVGAHILLVSWQLRFEVARTRDGDTRFQFMDRFNF